MMTTQSMLHMILTELRALNEKLGAVRGTDDEQILDAEGASELTGLSLSSLYAKTCSKHGLPPILPHFKQGKRVYFKRSELIAWMTSTRIKNREEIERDADAYRAAQRAAQR